jgi:hypothetical protein
VFNKVADEITAITGYAQRPETSLNAEKFQDNEGAVVVAFTAAGALLWIYTDTGKTQFIIEFEPASAPSKPAAAQTDKPGSQGNPYDWSTTAAQLQNADIPVGAYIKAASGKARKAKANEIAWAKKMAARKGGTPAKPAAAAAAPVKSATSQILEKTSMQDLLRANDQEITALVMREIKERDISPENVSVEYILRDKDSQALAVKVRTNGVGLAVSSLLDTLTQDSGSPQTGKLGSQGNPYDWSTTAAQLRNADIPVGSYIKIASGKVRKVNADEIAWAKREAARRGITPYARSSK